MIELVKNILKKWGCHHDWWRYHRSKVFEGEKDELPSKITDTLVCRNCGKIKKISL